jgi:hypothetical protein
MMLRAHGYVRIFSLDSDHVIEEDTVKCCHHQAVGFVQPGGLILWPQVSPVPQEQYTCRLCHQPICPRCANLPCRHYEKWLERVESNAGMIRLNLERMEERQWQGRNM